MKVTRFKELGFGYLLKNLRKRGVWGKMTFRVIDKKQGKQDVSINDLGKSVDLLQPRENIPGLSIERKTVFHEVLNFGDLKLYNKNSAMLRLQKTVFTSKRRKTGIDGVDNVFGGLPDGLIIFVGEAGTGKSLLMKTIAKTFGKKALYLGCESRIDNPGNGVLFADYTRYLPNWQKAVDEAFGLSRDLDVELLCIDSLTTFCSGTNKAVMEADIRPAVFKIAQMCEGKMPVIGISEVRGSGNFLYPAGGQAIAHAASLYAWFNRFKADRWNYKKYHAEGEGATVWTVDVVKDKEGLALQGNEFRIVYNREHEPVFERISFKEESKKKLEGVKME